MTGSAVAALALLATLTGVVSGCRGGRAGAVGQGDIPVRASPAPSAPIEASEGVQFSEVAARAGITYRWPAPRTRPVNILQGIGYGCAFLDFDADGRLDAFLIGPRLALYRGDGRGNFQDVSEAVDLRALRGDFRGCAVGDYDNDGFPDIYLSAYRGGALLHNERGQRFRQVGGGAPAAQPWGSSCSFTDFDGDGRLDLYIGNYVQFSAQSKQLCDEGGQVTACGPLTYGPERGVFYQNAGGGKFIDRTRAWGADRVSGKALGVAAADFDGAGRPSLAIANDEVAGDLLLNRDGRFENIGVASGTAYTSAGIPQGGMGIDWGDFDNDGQLDLSVATFAGEAKPVYRNEGDHVFSEESARLGLVAPTRTYVAFGLKWLDANNDGWLDLLLANGHTNDNVASYKAELTYRQPTQLFLNNGGQRFSSVDGATVPALSRPIVGRGLATGDFDNDGRVDALVVDIEGAPLLLHNESRNTGHWLLARLVGTRSSRDGIGAVVTVNAGGRRLLRHCHTDGSYLSASDGRVHFGLGRASTADTVTVQWPSGRKDIYRDVVADRIITLTEGKPGPQ
jgi:hypothetical protein